MKPSTKPCPGCGTKGAYRKSDEVCGNCKNLINEARTRRAQIARLKDTEEVKLPFAHHCLPAIHYFRDFDRGADRQITEIMFDLIHLVGHQIDPSQSKLPPMTSSDHGYLIDGPSGCDTGGTTYWLIPRGLKKLLNTLYSAISTGAEFAYHDGKQTGHNLILGLATRQTSIDEFNEATVGQKLMRKGRAASRKRGRA